MRGILWLETNPKRDLESRVRELIDHFAEKHGDPIVIHVGKRNMIDRRPFAMQGKVYQKDVQIIGGTVQKNHMIVYGNFRKGVLT